jgi:hypothetical protein
LIYELRIYDVIPGKLPALHDRFANITSRYFEKYGMKQIGYWTEVIGTSNRLTYLLAYEDLAQREKAWAGFAVDEERLKAFAETERGGMLVERVENRILQPTSYSPMK